ncbi:MAG: chemotaxis protein CheW [Mariprofundaceae bacterium]|nr:chemotaxis protein CheW [Mariprofundaceae bacterium]
MSYSTSTANTAHTFKPMYLNFSFCQEQWRGKLISVQEVSPCDAPTGIPYVPVYIRGSINIAGWVAPVLDIHQYCGLAPQSLNTSKVAIVQFSEDDQEQLITHITNSFVEDNPSKNNTSKNNADTSSSVISDALFIGIAVVDGQLLTLMDAEQLTQQGIIELPNSAEVSNTA